MRARLKRVTLVSLAVAAAAMLAAFWEPDPWTAGVLVAVGALLFTFLVAGWRQIAREERDAEELAVIRSSIRTEAAAAPREDRPAPLPPRRDTPPAGER
jgi:predicted MFS family arabinose efflux permease